MVSPDGSLHQILAIAGEDLQVLILLDRHPETATVGASNAYGGNQKSVLHRRIIWRQRHFFASRIMEAIDRFLRNAKPVNFNQDDDLQEDRYGRRLPLEKFLGLGFRIATRWAGGEEAKREISCKSAFKNAWWSDRGVVIPPPILTLVFNFTNFD